jgi:hypothetical protein
VSDQRRLPTVAADRFSDLWKRLKLDPDDLHPSLDPAFIKYTDEMLREGQLNYLALTGELARTTLWRDDGVIHCPGTTQARSQMEASGGACSLVEVDSAGEIRITSVDTSCVDWKHIEMDVNPDTTLSSMLQQMKTRLIELKPGVSDRIWSVTWILRAALPVLQELARNDLDVAAAVELDELRHAGRTIRLLHNIRSLPNAWPTGDPPSALADQFQLFVARSKQLSDESLQSLIDENPDLSTGWKQRLTSLLPAVDPEQILALMRTHGAAWFEPDFKLDQLPVSMSDELIEGESEESDVELDESDEDVPTKNLRRSPMTNRSTFFFSHSSSGCIQQAVFSIEYNRQMNLNHRHLPLPAIRLRRRTSVLQRTSA